LIHIGQIGRKACEAVRPVFPTYVFAPKIAMAHCRTCQAKDLYLGSLSRDSWREISLCRSALKRAGSLKTWVSRCQRAPSTRVWYGPLSVITDVVPWKVIAVTFACEESRLSGSWWNLTAPSWGGSRIRFLGLSISSSISSILSGSRAVWGVENLS